MIPNSIYLSICIPAFGRLEYIIKTLNSIYADAEFQNYSLNDFEVIVSDNDSNRGLSQLPKLFPYKNFRYVNTRCEGFMNSFYAISYGEGNFLKLHNSQEIFKPGSLRVLIEAVKQNMNDKKLLFFSGGLLKKGISFVTESFDEFINETSYLSSWSNAFGIWKEDFDAIKDQIKLNKLFPHTSLLFLQVNKSAYLINDSPLFSTQFIPKRGGHNKFHAFSVEYPSILDCAVKNGYLTHNTRQKVIRQLMNEFLPSLFFNVRIAKVETYDYDGFRDNLKLYFPRNAYYRIIVLSLFSPIKIIWRKIRIKFFLIDSTTK
ncbi:glycosyltransferase family 2 protein [Sphingobacterium multivorum]|uniref:glycosyltransferase family 2 protein n=1 Tax=Sphingobacterium multivorum TaxID=28454 RepID=UPI003DA47796